MTTDSSNSKIVISNPFDLMCKNGFMFSKFTCIKFRTNHVNPNDKIIFKVLDPSELEIPTPFSPFRIIMTLDNASGVQLPAARKVRPTITSGMPNV